MSSCDLLYLLVVFLCQRVTPTGSTCNNDQISACRAAASSGQLSSYRGSGSCMLKQYVQYTHLCTVNDYLPSVDHCCCSLDTDRLLCCRYHQDWYHFRCMEAEDAVDIRGFHDYWLSRWYLVVPVVLCPLLLLLLLIIACCYIRLLVRRRRQLLQTSRGAGVTSSDTCWLAGLCCGDLEVKKRRRDNIQHVSNTNRNNQQRVPSISEYSMSLPAAAAAAAAPPVGNIRTNSPPQYTPPSNAVEPSAPPLVTSHGDDVTFVSVCSADDVVAARRSSPYCFRSDAVRPSGAPLRRSQMFDEQPPPSYESSIRLLTPVPR